MMKKTMKPKIALTEKEMEEMFKKQVGWVEKLAAFSGVVLAYALTVTVFAVLIKLLFMLWGWIL